MWEQQCYTQREEWSWIDHEWKQANIGGLSGNHGRKGEKDENYKIVDGWHTCHMCREKFGILLFHFKYHFSC